MTPPEDELTSQETLQTTFQLHTPMSIKGLTKHPVTWPAQFSIIHHSNLNVSRAQKELLQWHHRLGHMGFKKIQFLMRTGVLANTEATQSLHTSPCKLTT